MPCTHVLWPSMGHCGQWGSRGGGVAGVGWGEVVCQGKLARELLGRRAPGRMGLRGGLVLAEVARREARWVARRVRRVEGGDIVRY